MKRDMELIRKMILAAEDQEHGMVSVTTIDGYSSEQVGYHAYLIIDAELGSGVDVTTRGDHSPNYMLTRLTWAGHEFAAACRNEQVWSKTTQKIAASVGSVSMQVLSQVLASFAKEMLGLGP